MLVATLLSYSARRAGLGNPGGHSTELPEARGSCWRPSAHLGSLSTMLGVTRQWILSLPQPAAGASHHPHFLLVTSTDRVLTAEHDASNAAANG